MAKGINDDELKGLYIKCNELYFNNELPNDIVVSWSEKMTTTIGLCRFKRKSKGSIILIPVEIRLSKPYHMLNKEEILTTLLHEMIHVKYPRAGHNIVFKREMTRLNSKYDLGITLHGKGNRVVKYKYVCSACNLEYERAIKLKDYQLYRCECGGEIEEIDMQLFSILCK